MSNNLTPELITETVLGDVTCRCFPDDQHECKPCLLIRLIDKHVSEQEKILIKKINKAIMSMEFH